MKQVVIDWDTYHKELKDIENAAREHAYDMVRLYLKGDEDVAKWFTNDTERYGNIANVLNKYYIKRDGEI